MPGAHKDDRSGSCSQIPGDPSPYQAFYDRQADNERAELLSDASSLEDRGNSTAQRTSEKEVTAGIAEIVGNGGGSHTVAVMRFLNGDYTEERPRTFVHVGDTVQWTNLGGSAAHTVTFGKEPADLMPPSLGVTLDSDGVRHAIISSPSADVNSGFLWVPNQERIGFPQLPLDATRFRVTFTTPGTFNYICGLHDDLGMVGTVVVLR
jgi:plastocyanin